MKNKKVVTAIALVLVMAMNVSAFAHEAIVKSRQLLRTEKHRQLSQMTDSPMKK